jgi:hypothetical protein
MFTSQQPLCLQVQERESLQAVMRSSRSPAGWSRRAQVLLLLAEGLSVRRVEAQTGMSLRRIVYWKKRWQQQGLEGLAGAPPSRAVAFHAHLFLLVEPSGDLAGHDHPGWYPSGDLPIRPRLGEQNLGLCSALQPERPALPLDVSQPQQAHPCFTYFGNATLGAAFIRLLGPSKCAVGNSARTAR